MMRILKSLVALVALSVATAAFAVQPSEKLADPVKEARARAIAAELRCLVCQNQSIDDSDAPLAKDLRVLLREQIEGGATDAEAKAYIVARYGDFVLLRPPVKLETLLLWGAPLLALIAGGCAMLRAYRNRQAAPTAPAPLTADERARLREMGAEDMRDD